MNEQPLYWTDFGAVLFTVSLVCIIALVVLGVVYRLQKNKLRMYEERFGTTGYQAEREAQSIQVELSRIALTIGSHQNFSGIENVLPDIFLGVFGTPLRAIAKVEKKVYLDSGRGRKKGYLAYVGLEPDDHPVQVSLYSIYPLEFTDKGLLLAQTVAFALGQQVASHYNQIFQSEIIELRHNIESKTLGDLELNLSGMLRRHTRVAFQAVSSYRGRILLDTGEIAGNPPVTMVYPLPIENKQKIKEDHPQVNIYVRRGNVLDHASEIFLNVTGISLEDVSRKYLEASLDALTGIYNRPVIGERLHNEVSRAYRFARKLSVLMLDLDNFKGVNDRYGHHAGDVVLREVAVIIQSHIREVDTVGRTVARNVVGRFGDKGDEFIVLLPETDVQGALKVSRQILGLIEENEFEISSGKHIHVTASIGVATYPDVAESQVELLRKADGALYRSKEKGRNAVTVARKSRRIDLAG